MSSSPAQRSASTLAPSRREEYAAATRRAVVDAARELFRERGYVSTTVEQIARRARVSPATIYAQCGGKQGLLTTLMDAWTDNELVAQTARRVVEDAGSGPEVLAMVVQAYRAMHDRFGDITRVVVETAPHDDAAAACLTTAAARHRRVLGVVAARLLASGDARPELSQDDVVAALTFYYGFDRIGWVATQFGWDLDQAQDWITAQVERHLFDPDAL